MVLVQDLGDLADSGRKVNLLKLLVDGGGARVRALNLLLGQGAGARSGVSIVRCWAGDSGKASCGKADSF